MFVEMISHSRALLDMIDAETGLFMLPLTQKPDFYGYLNNVLAQAGVAPDADDAGPLDNVYDFQFS